jgi:ribosomal protein S17
MMTEHGAFQEARRIVSETGQTLFVFFTNHRNHAGIGKEVVRHYDVGIVVPLNGVQVGDRVRSLSSQGTEISG